LGFTCSAPKSAAIWADVPGRLEVFDDFLRQDVGIGEIVGLFEVSSLSQKISRLALSISQELYSIDHFLRCDHFRIESQPPDTFTQCQPMHFHENYAAMLVSSSVNLRRDLD
jgi:hypothetical protein